MEEKQCFAFYHNQIDVVNKTPYLELLLNVFSNSGALVTGIGMKYSDKILSSVLSSLTDRESKAIRLLYGIDGCGKKTVDEVAVMFDITTEHMIEFEGKILRKLRHPSRSKELTGNQKESIANVYPTSYLTRLDDILIEEILGIVEKKDRRNVYLNRIMKRYDFSIQNESFSGIKRDCDLDQLGLSVRSYNCLKRAGINTFSEIAQMSFGELKHVMNLEQKCYDEVKQKMKEFAGIPEDGCNTIIFTCNGEKTIYKYFDVDTQKIAKSIYINLINIKPDSKFILRAPLSPGLQDILILKGYLYIEDVYRDSEILVKQLQEFGFSDFAEEISVLKGLQESPIEDESVYIYPMNNEVREFIQNNECSSTSEFIEKAEGTKNEIIAVLAKELVDAGF